MWLQFNAQEVHRDFGHANELRLNQVRVFLPFGAREQDPKTFSSSLASFMDIAHQHRIGVMLVLVPYMSRFGNGTDVASGTLDTVGPTTRSCNGSAECQPSAYRAFLPGDPGGVDEYLDWAVPQIAALYEDTHDEHYLDVVRILLFDTKTCSPCRGAHYDLDGPGWQQENLGNGTRSQRLRFAPQLAAMDFREPPAPDHWAGRTRPGSVSATDEGKLKSRNTEFRERLYVEESSRSASAARVS